MQTQQQQHQKCCLHCPGKWTSSLKDRREEHSCCLPTYVRGNLKLSSLRKCSPGEAERAERLRGNNDNNNKAGIRNQPDRPSSCYDRFAIAKKFHDDNLQHQPLPDKVDDAVFTNSRGIRNFANGSAAQARLTALRRVSSGEPETQIGRRDVSRFCRKVRAGVQYGPTLGCKTPTTNMDLAICWEAPIDFDYEPPRPVHIDGTDGGPAPAIFALVEHETTQNQRETDLQHCKCFKNAVESYEAKFSNVRNRCRCAEIEKKARASSAACRVAERAIDAPPGERGENPNYWQCPADRPENFCKDEDENGDHGDLLCEEFNSIHISDKAPRRSSDLMRTKKQQPLHLRNCSSCECRGDRSARKPRPRLVQSAYAGTRNVRRNGLPVKISVPRPKTPYAKRSFCIDTLTPPFSIVNGCRDADYPEHWRLTSVYQQSYRNPRKQRGNILNYE